MAQLTLVTAPTAEPVSLADTKLHLRVGSDVTAEDDLIAGLIVSARDYAEAFTHRAIPQSTWDLKLSDFPADGGPLWLPKAPAISVTSITYVAQDGTSTVWDSADYTAVLPSGPKASRGYIVPAYGEYYPSTRDVPNAVIVRFVAGYAGTAVTLASLTQSSGTATATVTAGHGLTDLQMVTIAGAAQAGYNGSFTATYVSATVFTFPVASGTVSPATGTITATPDPVPTMIKVCMKEHVRANYGRGGEDRVEIMQWIDRNLWAFKSF